MHPLIDRIRAVRRELANEQWEPVSITLGWVTHDLFWQALDRELPYAGAADDPERTAILGIAVIRDDRFPIGGHVRFDRDVYRSPYERQTEHYSVTL